MSVHGAMTSSLPPESVIKPGHVQVAAGVRSRGDVADARRPCRSTEACRNSGSSLVAYTMLMYGAPDCCDG